MIPHLRTTTVALVVSWGLLGCRRPVAPASAVPGRTDLDAWIEDHLSPAKQPPPTLDNDTVEVVVEGLRIRATWTRPETEVWNTWTDGRARLFNDREAILFDLTIEGTGSRLQWLPEETRVELNVEGDGLPAASHQDILLEGLLFWAAQAEQSAVHPELAHRLRAAGPLRRRWIPRIPGDRLQGLIGFPLRGAAHNDRDTHIASMRLTIGIAVDGIAHRHALLFD